MAILELLLSPLDQDAIDRLPGSIAWIFHRIGTRNHMPSSTYPSLTSLTEGLASHASYWTAWNNAKYCLKTKATEQILSMGPEVDVAKDQDTY